MPQKSNDPLLQNEGFYIMGFLVFTSAEKIHEGENPDGGNVAILLNFGLSFTWVDIRT
jgi:hypothetical protein